MDLTGTNRKSGQSHLFVMGVAKAAWGGKRLAVCCWMLVLVMSASFAQTGKEASIVARVIALGGGEQVALSGADEAVLAAAVDWTIEGKTTVLFLGDVLPPKGMGGNDNDLDVAAQILKKKYGPFQGTGSPVYFIPGEKDWDNKGPEGIQRVNRSARYIANLEDSLIRQVPEAGCPDPYLIPVADRLAIIVMDSQWWLHGFQKELPGGDCNCSNERDITNALRELLYQNRDKTIILATHHPFADYGYYNGDFSWKEHLFPLTSIEKNLYLPLPGVGSLYPALNRAFQSSQQLHHPLYKQMRSMVGKVLKGYPNVIHLSAHEPGLQLIDRREAGEDSLGGLIQIISAGLDPGARSGTGAMGGRYSRYHSNEPGFVVLDQYGDGHIEVAVVGAEIEGDSKEASGFKRRYVYDFQPKSFEMLAARQSERLQGDSVRMAAHPAYGEVSGMHRWLFGKNYRAAWALPVKLPVLRVSELYGGLKPVKLGGGFQSTSLRMENREGVEYNLRSVEKSSDLITPEPFQGTFVKDWLDDATSAQHPYSALVVPPLAEAVGVFHSSPVIGVVAPDSALGAYGRLFEGKVTLLEQREPAGNTDNTLETLEKLQDDNDDDFDSDAFVRARGLDYLIADWDRHEDQWRFQKTGKKGKPKYFRPVPRDRDMALNVTQGVIPSVLRKLVLMPRVFGFSQKNPLRGSNYYFYKSAFLDAHPRSQISFDRWHDIAVKEQEALTDSVLRTALRRMPPEILALDYETLFGQLRRRRDHLTEVMDKYYRFSNRYVDIRASDKNELVEILDVPQENALEIRMRKISKKGNIQDTLMHKIYPRQDTREIRLYLGKGDDSVYLNNTSSSVRLRLIGGKGHKSYHVDASNSPVRIYDHQRERYSGAARDRLRVSVSEDSLQTAFVRTNRYSTVLPLATVGYNADDKLLLGVGARLTLQNGFRKFPYRSMHQLMVRHAFATSAYSINYSGIWKSVAGKADLVTELDVKAPHNTQNFFGRGNESSFRKTDGFQRFYRARFTTVDLLAGLRWNFDKGSFLQVGPGFQYYHMEADENRGRFVQVHPELIGSYDSSTLLQDKLHLGLNAVFELDRRNNPVLPAWGVYARVALQAYKGLNDLSRTFARIQPEVAVYKPLNNRGSLVLSNRLGGGVSLGHTAFYQSVFLGGEGTLMGYRKYRFAGQQAVYNNLELRWSVMDFGNYVVKGELGLNGFFDIGRVWQQGQRSDKWHNGVGGGIYFSPAGLTVFRLYMGHSSEGWLPYFSMGLRF